MIEHLWTTPVLTDLAPFNEAELARLASFAKEARALFDSGATQSTLPQVDTRLKFQFNALLEPYASLAPKAEFDALQRYVDSTYRQYMREALGVQNSEEVEYVCRILPVNFGKKWRRVPPHYHHTCDHVMCVYLETGTNRVPRKDRDSRIGDGELILCDPRPMASFPFWEKTRIYDPYPGMVILHPSQVWHETNPFTSDGDRTLLTITLKVISHNYCDLYTKLNLNEATAQQ
jgi:mannose-6-phosphate isomerase-like protein (cupin superfamily)